MTKSMSKYDKPLLLKIRGTGLTRYPSEKEDKNRIKDVVVRNFRKFEEILRNSDNVCALAVPDANPSRRDHHPIT